MSNLSVTDWLTVQQLRESWSVAHLIQFFVPKRIVMFGQRIIVQPNRFHFWFVFSNSVDFTWNQFFLVIKTKSRICNTNFSLYLSRCVPKVLKYLHTVTANDENGSFVLLRYCKEFTVTSPHVGILLFILNCFECIAVSQEGFLSVLLILKKLWIVSFFSGQTVFQLFNLHKIVVKICFLSHLCCNWISQFNCNCIFIFSWKDERWKLNHNTCSNDD